MYFAHSICDKSKSDWQVLSSHLAAVATLAAERGDKFGVQKAAALAGLFHDLGKYSAAFQRRLDGGPSVDHATAGAQQVRNLPGADRGMTELIAYAIAGHHGGLPDKEGETGSLADRLKKSVPLDPAWKDEVVSAAAGLMPNFRWNRIAAVALSSLACWGA
jgi:CRISPR-associated endonuclease/helicase Cas3